ncbi:MAG: metal-sensing transcriptional repressor [Limnohabitans sp.]|nr:metal-sensing transcriptional repressor [Limnohabitans sp.]
MVLRDLERKRSLCARLARIEGQLRGLQKLIDQEDDAIKISQQMSAARKALDKSFYALIAGVIEQGDHPVEHVTEILTKFS